MDSKQRQDISEVINNLGTIQKFDYLHERWQDEKEYEDFNEYVKAMMKSMPEGATLVKGHKRPFGVTFNYGGNEVQISLKRKDGYCSLVAKIAR